jgi:hypothetical protein
MAGHPPPLLKRKLSSLTQIYATITVFSQRYNGGTVVEIQFMYCASPHGIANQRDETCEEFE